MKNNKKIGMKNKKECEWILNIEQQRRKLKKKRIKNTKK